jgi:hypothetical protein
MLFRSAIICLGSISVGFLAGAATSAARGWGSPVVSLDVINRSGRTAQSVSVEYESCGTRSVLPGRPLAGGAATKFQFLVCGEGGYHVVAHFDGGAELWGREAYVETGYRATEVLLSQEIQSSVDSHPY